MSSKDTVRQKHIFVATCIARYFGRYLSWYTSQPRNQK
ncbi:hypothetical protein FOVG_12873 [Fusarium oxysporum f. sp. pisi HDV247]|uniref:Uncharacterized protein n=3 Tax=Fusarium oxysporum TaxID=5507 RepID=X0L3P2_FUSOX|nr:hypothetical protein FOZG_14334 [Fusarium oxysporum Fo47]EWZ85778.1 hypothetical protein FOWG_10874 [Fusarium oxysporum f. sp. lycopersici MN25]EXA35718.1 hypothetical protein FOVG_12873 [Fusarium oxysporum f. sp. pisi HDV247]EXM20438.1 hypothetical protein FOTG_11566 [Fusarium oxysporum f. sp. vasinfectum 25433]